MNKDIFKGRLFTLSLLLKQDYLLLREPAFAYGLISDFFRITCIHNNCK